MKLINKVETAIWVVLIILVAMVVILCFLQVGVAYMGCFNHSSGNGGYITTLLFKCLTTKKLN